MVWVYGLENELREFIIPGVINWVKQVGKLLPEVYDPEVIPEVGELDELQTYVKKNRQNLVADGG